MEKASQKLRRWLCALAQCDDLPSEVQKIGPNIEVFEYDGYQVETTLYKDYLYVALYLKGVSVLGGKADQKGFNWDQCQTLIRPNYKVRAYLREYAVNRFLKMKDSK